MAVYKPKLAKIIAVRQTASTPSQPTLRPPVCTVIVTDMFMDTSNKLRKLKQMIHEIKTKISPIEPMNKKLYPFTYLTKASKNPLPEHLASVYRAIDSEIMQGNPRWSNVVAFNVSGHIPSDLSKSTLILAYISFRRS